MRKRLLSLVLAAAMCCSMIPVTTSAAEVGTRDTALNFYLGRYTAITKDGTLYGWGDDYWKPTAYLQDVVKAETAYMQTVALKTNGDLHAWGYWGSIRYLANGLGREGLSGEKILSNVKDFRLGDDHGGAITEDGSLYLWGSNEFGQIGDGTTTDRTKPVKVLSNVVAMELSNDSASGWNNAFDWSAAITEDGSLYLWGGNIQGQVGDGSTRNQLTPQKVLSDVVSVKLSNDTKGYSAALTKDGSFYMWGGNYGGQIGNGTTKDQLTPVKVLSDVASFALGEGHSAAITEDGSLYVWGKNASGQIGDGTRTDKWTPTKIMENIAAVDLGPVNSAALDNNGCLYVWGDNDVGQIGNGTNADQLKPTKVMENIVDFCCDYYVGAVTAEGVLYGWGMITEIAQAESAIRNPRKVLENVRLPDSNEIKVILNGEKIKFDQPPVIIDDRILVPIRKIAEAMGDDVYWNDKEKTAYIDHGDRGLIIKLYDDKITVVDDLNWAKWTEKWLDVPALILNGRTLVPVRAFCESLGADVQWNGEERTAYITYDFDRAEDSENMGSFSQVNTVYDALNRDGTLFDGPSADFDEFYDQRDRWRDAMTMGMGDVWMGLEDLLSGLTNAQSTMKDSVGAMLTVIPDNEIVSVNTQIYKDLTNWALTGKDLYCRGAGLDKEFLALHPDLKGLSDAIDALGKVEDVLIFSTEQLAVFLSNYETNIKYIHTLRDSLDEQDLLSKELSLSLSALEREYANEYWHIMTNTRDELAKFTVTEGIDWATGGAFKLGSFAWEYVCRFSGVTGNSEALQTFYGLYCINGALDCAYKAAYGKVISGNYGEEDVLRLKQLDDMQRATKCKMYEAIGTITNDKATKEYCKMQQDTFSVSNMLWKPE